MDSKWELDDIINYFHSDPEIKEAMTREDFDELLNPDMSFLEAIKNALEYPKYDPRITWKQIIKNRNAYAKLGKDVLEWDVTNISGNFKKTANSKAKDIFKSDEPLLKDLEFLTMAYLAKYNHISKTISKAIGATPKILLMLKEKYDIKDGNQLGLMDVTLPRIVTAMPGIAVRLFHQQRVQEKVPCDSLPGVLVEGESSVRGLEKVTVSHAICCPYLPSVHPHMEAGKSNLHGIMLYVALVTDDTIHKKDKNYTPLEDIMKYYKARYESTSTSQQLRFELMVKIGLMKKDKTGFTDEALSINEACYKAILGMRPEDSYRVTYYDAARTGQMPI